MTLSLNQLKRLRESEEENRYYESLEDFEHSQKMQRRDHGSNENKKEENF